MGGEGHAIFGIARRAESPAQTGPRMAQERRLKQDQVGAADAQGVFDVSVKTQTSFCGLPFPLTPLTARWRDDEWPPLRSPAACRTARAAADGPEGLRQPRPSGVGDGRPGQTADPHLPCLHRPAERAHSLTGPKSQLFGLMARTTGRRVQGMSAPRTVLLEVPGSPGRPLRRTWERAVHPVVAVSSPDAGRDGRYAPARLGKWGGSGPGGSGRGVSPAQPNQPGRPPGMGPWARALGRISAGGSSWPGNAPIPGRQRP